MRKKTGSIPVNSFGGINNAGIVIERITLTDTPDSADWEQPERHDRHSFFLVEKGSVTMEIDFQKYVINSPAIAYMNANQVHRVIAIKNVTVSALAINNEELDPEYLKLLEDIAPVKPLHLEHDDHLLISEAVSLCIKFAEREKDKLHYSLLKNSCNTLIALVISLLMEKSGSTDSASRFDIVYKSFREALEQHFINIKRPVDYAQKLNISESYLNECVKNTTGYTVSYHIQQRIILEAKRLLYHSNSSVKEISALLGYDDYPYFTRLFIKVTGITALSFRNKNRN